ncbi:MAG: c-type cytochrome [Boseongicola sp.]
MRAWASALLLTLVAVSASAGEFFTLKGHGGPIMGVASNGTQIATASFDNSVGIWSGARPEWLEGHQAAVNAVAFVGKELAVSAGDDFALILWDLSTGIGTRLDGHRGKVKSLAVSPDKGLIASASWDGSIGLWPVYGGEPIFLLGHTAGVSDVVFSEDGARLYSASLDGTIRVWDIETSKELEHLVKHGFGVNSLVRDPANQWLAYGAVDGATRILALESGDAIADFTLERRPILAMATDSDGHVLAVGDGQGFIMVIDTKGWRIIHDFRATLGGPIWALEFSADDENILAGGLDDAMYSWPLATLDAFAPMPTEDRSFLEDPSALSNGERQFKRKCSICHSLTESSARKAGPTLYGVFGRRAGTVADYKYSSTLDGSDIFWSALTIDGLFDQGPDHFIPGTKMPMQRIASAQDRLDLIEYLQRETAQREN